MRGAGAELQRLKRRALAHPWRTLAVALAATLAVVGMRARKVRTFSSRVVFRVTEGDLDAATSPRPAKRLREYVLDVAFSNQRLLDVIREHNPAAVLTHSDADFHNDHLLIYQACLPTQRLAHFDFFCYHPTNCRPVPVRFHPCAYVDITDTIDAKMHAIAAHASQFGGRGLDTEMYREFAHLQGRMVGVPYAEGLDVNRMLLS